ncbi:MAG: diadenylate cyclase CdaA [Candidatus Cloacimonadia bacterium]
MSFLIPSILDIIDILLVAYIFYRLFLLVRGTKVYPIIWLLILIIILYFIAQLLNLTLLGSIVNILADFWFIAFIVLFQPEIRTAVIKIRQRPFFRSLFPQKQSVRYSELLNAIRIMTANKIGGLFVVEKEASLAEYIATGEVINAEISEKLILTIFNPKTALHDGAIVIKDNRIVAARVILPLTSQEKYVQKYSTRHQAGIGISEQTDAFVIIVSEETGKISTAKNGMINEDISIDILTQRLRDEIEG